MINNLPTIYEVVTGTAKKQSKEKTPNSSSKSNKSNSKAVNKDAIYSTLSHFFLFSSAIWLGF